MPAPGSRIANKPLAAVYRRILTEAEHAAAGREAQIEAARSAFYKGFVAEHIAGYLDRAEVMDVTGRPHKGLLDGRDLASWRASVESPVTFEFRGVTVCKTGPWGQGPVFLQQLALMDGLGIERAGFVGLAESGPVDRHQRIGKVGLVQFADLGHFGRRVLGLD